MENKCMSIQAQCEDCGKEFTVNATNGTTRFNQQFKCGENIIFLTYYTCPHCGRIHYVQIDNANSLAVMRTTTKTFKRLSKQSLSGQLVSQSKNDKFKKMRRHLATIRKALMDEYTGKTVVEVSTGKVVENLRFSV